MVFVPVDNLYLKLFGRGVLESLEKYKKKYSIWYSFTINAHKNVNKRQSDFQSGSETGTLRNSTSSGKSNMNLQILALYSC